MIQPVVATVPPAPVRSRVLVRHPAWPVTVLLVGYPLWWALGIADYMFVIMAIPMAARLYAWSARDNRRLRVPPGFALWLLFLVCTLAGVAALKVTAPGTLASPVSNRIISYAIRAAGYLGATVTLLFAGNLTEQELPRRRLAQLLGLVALYAIVGGLAGTFFGTFQFTSPLAAIVPNRLQANNLLLQQQLHPSFAQVQSVLGSAQGRPDAPFVYTNEWGNCLALLVPWLIAHWWFLGTRRQRLVAGVGAVVAIVPVVYSLNRGLWLGIGVGFCYLAVRFAARGRLGVLAVLVAAVALTAVVIEVSPLHSIISQRLSAGASYDRRASLASTAIQDAGASPLIGYGDTRHQRGSVQSVTVGRSAKCPTCGNGTVGGNGQLWLLLVCSGYLGAGLYLSFFAYGCWRYRHDQTPFGLAGVLVLLLGFVFMVSYTATGPPLGFTMLSYALLWRNDRARLAEVPPPQRAALMTGMP